jgi:hypothetical protein
VVSLSRAEVLSADLIFSRSKRSKGNGDVVGVRTLVRSVLVAIVVTEIYKMAEQSSTCL